MKGKRLLLAIACFAMIGVLLAGFGLGCKTTPTTTEKKTLEIGAILALTGWFAPNEVKGAHELDCMLDIINEEGGIKVGDEEYEVEVTIVDNQSSLDGTATAANQLAYENKVKFVLETLGFLSISGNSIFTENKILAVNPYNTLVPDEIGTFTPYKFIGTVSIYGNILATFAGAKQNFPGIQNVVCVNPDDGTIAGSMAVVNAITPGLGINVIGDCIGYSPDTVDYNPIASKVNAIPDVDAVIVTGGTVPQLASTIKALRSMGNDKPMAYVGSAAGSELADIMGVEYANNIQTLGMMEDPNNPPVLNELIKRLKTKYDDTFSFGNDANCLYLLKQVIEEAESLDTTVVRDTWENMATFDTIYGEATLGGLELYGIKHAVVHPMPTQLVMDGEGTQGPWILIDIP